MSKHPVDLTKYPNYDPNRPNYRRRCSVCGRWIVVHSKGKYFRCENCKGEPIPGLAEKKGASLLDYERKSFYRVVSCPDPYGYRRGAMFAAGEITEMKRLSILIPGMILERGGARYVCKRNRLEELEAK